MSRPQDLYADPNALASYYSKFRVAARLLLTGHSHQAWPDCGYEAHCQAWLDAAEYVDDKWDRAFTMAERTREGYRRLLDDVDGHIALGSNTHELLVRFLSALPLKERPKLVTSDGEFHSLRRQLDRLEEEGLQVVRVPHLPAADVAARLSAVVDDRTAAVLVSAVFYEDARIAPGLGRVMEACRKVGAELLVDVYHALNAVPFSLQREGLAGAFAVGGGYKYCQLGEGNCFLRFPSESEYRPVISGWFSEFDALTDRQGRSVVYGPGPARFAGATYDPTSHYRAAAVFDFFEQEGLTPELLREVSQHQITILADAFDTLDADPAAISRDREIPISQIGGFLPLRSPRAEAISQRLRERGVFTDYRGDVLRLGPAPYLSDAQLVEAMAMLGGAVIDESI